MSAEVGTAFVNFRGDFSSLNKEVGALLGPLTSKFGKLGIAGAAGLGVVAGGAIAAGNALYDVGEQFDEAYDTIRVKTGATGKHLQGLETDFKKVVSSVPADFAEAGEAVGGLNQRLGLTGKPLQEVSKRVLELSRLTETDLSGNIASITRLFADWSVKTAQQPATLDKLFRASQATGIEIGKLSEYMVQFGSPLRQLGFDFDTAAAMFSKFEKEGVNLQTLMPGLRMALKNLANPTDELAGKLKGLGITAKEPDQALREVILTIEKAKTVSDATDLASGVFGGRAWSDAAAAIQEGRFNFSELIHTIDGGKDTIMGAARETEDFSEKWQIFKNRVMVDLEPLATRVFGAVGDEMERIGDILTDPHLSNDEKFSQIFEVLSDQASQAFSEIASQAGHYAPVAAESFVKGFVDADAWGKVLIGALVITKLGGWKAVGERVGMTMGAGVAEGVTGTQTTGKLAGRLRTNMLGIAKGIGFTMGAIGVVGGIEEGVSTASRGGGFKETLHDSLTGFLSDASFGALDPLLGKTFSEVWDESAQEALKSMGEMPLNFKGGLALTGLGPKQHVTAEQYAELLGLPGADDWSKMTHDQQESFRRVFQSLRASAGFFRRTGVTVPVNIKVPQPAHAFKALGDGITFLKRGIGANMADINRVITRNMHLARVAAGGDMQAFRKLTSENMRAAAGAIEKQMDRSGNKTQDGMQRIRNLIRNANLIDPSRQQAKAFGDQWASGMDRSKRITHQGIQDLIDEAWKMPGPMRQVALQTWLEQIKQAKRSGDITVGEFRRMRSRVLSEFGSIQQGGKQQSKGLADGVIGNISRLVNTTGSALGVFRDNVSAALDAFGVKAQQFEIKTVAAAGGGEARRQTGGIVPGQGDGDRPGFAAQVGSFVLNREATAAYGFRSGGIVPVALEAGERVFNPGEVRRIGRGRLEAMNAAVPRFQTGGHVGGPEPQILGPDPLRALGQGAVHDAYGAGMDYLRKHMGPRPGLGTFDGKPVSAWIIPILEWARQHGWGGSVTSGFRTPAEQIAAATGYGLQNYGAAGPLGSNHVGVNYPRGAVDVSLAAQLAAILKGYPGKPNLVWGEPVMGDYVHFSATGHQLGGIVEAVQQLADGGWVKTGYTIYTGDGPGAFGDLQKGDGYAELGTATQGGSGTGHGYIAQALGMSGELPKDFPLDVKVGSEMATLYKRDRGYGQGTSAYSIDIHQLAWDELGLSMANGKGSAHVRPAGGKGADTDEHNFKEDVPAVFHGCRTDALSFGSVPKSLQGVEHELRQRRSEIRQYRKAAAHAAKETKPAIEHALRANVTALESRIRQLEHERAKMRREAAQKRFAKHLGKKLGKLTGFEDLIAGKERVFNAKSQFAEQLVDLEPLAPELPANATDAQRDAAEKQHVTDLTAYIEGRERPAYTELLGVAADWRNTILAAEAAAAGQWVKGEGLGGLEGRWEDQVVAVDHEIDRISHLSDEHTQKWWNEHPKAKEHLHQQLSKLPMLRFKDRELRKALGEAREQFYPGKSRVAPPSPPLAGSGAFEDALTNVQGIHWPDQHEVLGSLPSKRVAGSFGGAIWDVQASIEGLGLKISDASASIGAGGDSSEDDSESKALFEELARQESQRADVSDTQKVTLEDWDAMRQGLFARLPKFHTGGTVMGPPGRETPVMALGSERIRTPEQELEMATAIRGLAGGAGEPPKVIINGNIVQEPGDTRDPVEVVLNDRRFAPAVQQLARAGRGVGLTTPGGMRR